MPKQCKISFGGDTHPPMQVDEGSNLSEILDIANSPILFGCRTGICGTCLINVDAGEEEGASPRNEEEQALIPILAPDHPHARLACQMRPQGDLTIRPLRLE
ncbi:(2Fe-2S)-binding protein [bacterium]|nr:(2Fe-2S)-binding protein [bacterium]